MWTSGSLGLVWHTKQVHKPSCKKKYTYIKIKTSFRSWKDGSVGSKACATTLAEDQGLIPQQPHGY